MIVRHQVTLRRGHLTCNLSMSHTNSANNFLRLVTPFFLVIWGGSNKYRRQVALPHQTPAECPINLLRHTPRSDHAELYSKFISGECECEEKIGLTTTVLARTFKCD